MLVINLLFLFGFTLESAVCSFISINRILLDKSYSPVRLTSTNLPTVMHKMTQCNVYKAQVLGWNDHDQIYIVYANGAVVPATKETLPSIAIYSRRCKNEIYDIVFVVDCSGPAGPAGPAACSPAPVNHITQPVSYDTCQPCPAPPDQCQPKPNPCLSPVEIADACFVECQDQCRPVTRTCCKKQKSKNCKKFEILKCTRVYEFSCQGSKTILTVDLWAENKAKAFYVLDGKTRLSVKALNYPQVLARILEKARNDLGPAACLYVNDFSELFILYQCNLYAVCKDYDFYFNQLDGDGRKEAERKGLALIQFRK